MAASYCLPPFRVEARWLALAETIDWGLATYGVPQQWKRSRGAGVKVAVLDSGVEADHPDLAGAVLERRDFTEHGGLAEDRLGHGTHVAGVIAARDNGGGVVGVAPECSLLIGKVLGDDGSGDAARVAAGIDWACEAGAELISMSLGSPDPDEQLRAALQRALERGVYVACAAGNDGRRNSVNYPARWGCGVTVGAVDRQGRVAPFSSMGPEVDVCAPGTDVLSTYLRHGYAKLSGTSMATPFVAGVIALWLARQRQSSSALPPPRELVALLRRTAVDAGPAGKDPQYGYGLIHPESVLAGDHREHPPCELGPIRFNGVEGMLVFVARASA
jgi:subtilisin family serine protease